MQWGAAFLKLHSLQMQFFFYILANTLQLLNICLALFSLFSKLKKKHASSIVCFLTFLESLVGFIAIKLMFNFLSQVDSFIIILCAHLGMDVADNSHGWMRRGQWQTIMDLACGFPRGCLGFYHIQFTGNASHTRINALMFIMIDEVQITIGCIAILLKNM